MCPEAQSGVYCSYCIKMTLESKRGDYFPSTNITELTNITRDGVSCTMLYHIKIYEHYSRRIKIRLLYSTTLDTSFKCNR